MKPAWVAFIAAVVLLTGCVSSTPVQPRPDSTPGAGSTPGSGPGMAAPTGAAGSTAHVLGQRRAAGIGDCPVSDQAVPARPDGLPDVTLDCLGADSRVRLAGLRGTPMVVNVWAQWCGPCREEAPFLREASDRAGERVQFLGIDYVDPRPDLAVEFAEQAGWRYPQLADPEKAIAADLRIIGPPQTILVTADGRVAHRHPGPVTSTVELVDLINTHLDVRL